MPVFHIYLNGRKASTAGVGDLGVLSAHVTWVRRKGEHTLAKATDSVEEELTLHVGGLISPVEEHVRWLDRALKIGDEVRITVAEDYKWPSDSDERYRQRGNTALTEQHADGRKT